MSKPVGMATFLLNETRTKILSPEHIAKKPRVKGIAQDGKLTYHHTVWKFRISKKSSLFADIMESPHLVLEVYIHKNRIVLDKPTIFNLLALKGGTPHAIEHLYKATLGGFECLQILNDKATARKPGFDELVAL